MGAITTTKISTLISHFNGLENSIELSTELPHEQIKKIFVDSQQWPIQTRPYYIARAVSRLSAFFYHVKSDKQKWNPLTTSYSDFMLQNPEAETWIDEDRHPCSNDILAWLAK